jgi:hypothetical protein
MKREESLSLRHWPALLSIEETAWVLGVEQYYIMVLVAASLLRPAGRPAANGRKFFSREYILERAKDEAWLGRAATAMVNFNASRNHGRTSPTRDTEKDPELEAA